MNTGLGSVNLENVGEGKDGVGIVGVIIDGSGNDIYKKSIFYILKNIKL